MLTIESISTLQKIMISGCSMSDGTLSPIETQLRCVFCANDCKAIPVKCDKYEWDYEMNADVLKDTWL